MLPWWGENSFMWNNRMLPWWGASCLSWHIPYYPAYKYRTYKWKIACFGKHFKIVLSRIMLEVLVFELQVHPFHFQIVLFLLVFIMNSWFQVWRYQFCERFNKLWVYRDLNTFSWNVDQLVLQYNTSKMCLNYVYMMYYSSILQI